MSSRFALLPWSPLALMVAVCSCDGGQQGQIPGSTTTPPPDAAVGGVGGSLPEAAGGGSGGSLPEAGSAAGAGGFGTAGAAGAEPCTPATEVIVNAARGHLGADYEWGAEGPGAFDCSGLVYAVFRDTGYFDIIGNGSARTVSQIAAVFAARGDEDTVSLQVGDLITFGNTDGYGAYQHIGIYVGATNVDGDQNAAGWIVNALNEQTGVVENKVDWLIPGVQSYLHTRLAEKPCTPVE